MIRILVTGGAGFIGSCLVNRLSQKHEVRVLDNLSTGKKDWIKDVELFEGSILNIDDLKFTMGNCDAVFHLAAIAEVMAGNSHDINEVNFSGACNVFQVAKDLGVKVIFSSSAAIYGNAPLPNKEAAACNPISEYGRSKLLAEQACQSLCPDAFVARFFNVYGPHGHGAVNIFCEKMLADDELNVFGKGKDTRDYVYVDDVVDAILLGIKKKGIYNIGTGKEISVLDLIDRISKVSGKKAKKNFMPARKEDISRSVADITKIKKLGWKPKTSLDKGIKLTLESI